MSTVTIGPTVSAPPVANAGDGVAVQDVLGGGGGGSSTFDDFVNSVLVPLLDYQFNESSGDLINHGSLAGSDLPFISGPTARNVPNGDVLSQGLAIEFEEDPAPDDVAGGLLSVLTSVNTALQALGSSGSFICIVRTTDTDVQQIFTIEDNVGNQRFRISTDSGGHIDANCYDDSAANGFSLLGTVVINDGDWHMFVVVQDGVSAVSYMDGVSDDGSAGGNNPGFWVPSIYSPSAPTKIGVGATVSVAGTSGSQGFTGDIDRIIFSPTVLTASQIEEMWFRYGTTSTLFTITLGQSGNLNGWFDAGVGAIDGDRNINGNEVWGIYYDDFNNIWWMQITSAAQLPNDYFSKLTIVTDGGTVELLPGDASVNYQTGRTRWQWGSQLIGWEDAEVGETREATITFVPAGETVSVTLGETGVTVGYVEQGFVGSISPTPFPVNANNLADCFYNGLNDQWVVGLLSGAILPSTHFTQVEIEYDAGQTVKLNTGDATVAFVFGTTTRWTWQMPDSTQGWESPEVGEIRSVTFI